MLSLAQSRGGEMPPFIAKLIGTDGVEEKKYFETKAAAEKWALGEGKNTFDGDIERAEIHHTNDGLVWFKDHPKVEDDWRYRRMRSDPNSWLSRRGIPPLKPRPDIEAYCDICKRMTMNWRVYEERYGIALMNKPLLKCGECHNIKPDIASWL
jgi:hypothetical protein